jgi:hypothetical protein
MSEKFEKLLDLLVNEEKAKAEELFHEIVVDKSRDIYEELVSNDAEKESIEEKKKSDDESVEETKEEDKKEEVDEKAETKADEDKKEVDEKAETKADEDKKEVDEKAETKADENKKVDETEAIETIGGDATDDLVRDVSTDQIGLEPAQADEDMTQDELEDKVLDLEDALEELKAEFAAMDGGNGDDENGDEPEMDIEPEIDAEPEVDAEIEFPAPEEEGLRRRPFEGRTAKNTKSVDEHLKEYSEMVKADMSGDDDGGSKKSPVASKNDMGGTSANIAKGGEEKGGSTPTSETKSDKFANRPGGSSKNMTSPAPKPKDDKGDMSAKSPVGPGK